MRAVIFANGWLSDPSSARVMLKDDDLIIAADGGAAHCERLGVQPDFLIGDFDSIQPELLSKLKTTGTQVITYPRRKDYTDLELALRLAHDKGAGEALVIAAAGSRLDQTAANLLLPALPELAGMRVRMVDGRQEAALVLPGAPLEISGEAGDIVSLIPVGGRARGVSSQGLEYPLVSEPLEFGSTRGVSNVLTGSAAQVSLEEGCLLCVVIHGVLDTPV